MWQAWRTLTSLAARLTAWWHRGLMFPLPADVQAFPIHKVATVLNPNGERTLERPQFVGSSDVQDQIALRNGESPPCCSSFAIGDQQLESDFKVKK